MKISRLQEVCSSKKISSVLFGPRKRVSVMKKEMLEAEGRTLATSIRPTDFQRFPHDGKERNRLTEMERKMVVDSIAMVGKIWASISQGANTAPRAHLEMVKDLLGLCTRIPTA